MNTETFKNILRWAQGNALGNKVSAGLVFATITSVVITYILITNAPPLQRDTKLIIFFIYLDLVLLLSLGSLVAYRLVKLWQKQNQGQAGPKLHIRMVGIFSILAIAPTIFMAIFSTLFFQIGVQGWFNERVEAAVGESLAVARAYMGEHQKVISANAQSIAIELYPYFQGSKPTRDTLNEKLTEQVALRSLNEAIIFDRNMDILGRSRFAFSMDFEAIQARDLNRSAKAPVIYTSEGNSRVRALEQIDSVQGIFLLVGRNISPEVLSRVEHTEQAVSEYEQLAAERSHLAVTLSMIFVCVALMLLLAAVWGAIHFANKLANPIGQLIDAAEEVRKGNLSVKLSESEDSQELESLILAFNRMTAQLRSQRKDLITANDQLDRRRRFTEAVLSGVSAGVIGLDKEGAINFPNHSASRLLDTDLSQKIGEKLGTLFPEFEDLFARLEGTEKGTTEGEIHINRKGHNITLLMKLSVDLFDGGVQGYVLTFDDITELQSAQRQAAWSDVARRIAHEIKNPLTPIQLSAERLKRRYLKEIQDSPKTFQSCIDTIIRQVEHIGSMVSEFASFARMPEPIMQITDLVGICKNAIFLQRQSFPRIKFKFDSLTKSLSFQCDGCQIEHALTNLLKNAGEAVEAKGQGHKGIITVTLDQEPNLISLTIDDNGIGLPQEGRERLSEPYVTHREKGTGLGLAIVKRIVEDHNGYINLAESDLGGARVSIVFHQSIKDHRLAS